MGLGAHVHGHKEGAQDHQEMQYPNEGEDPKLVVGSNGTSDDVACTSINTITMGWTNTVSYLCVMFQPVHMTRYDDRLLCVTRITQQAKNWMHLTSHSLCLIHLLHVVSQRHRYLYLLDAKDMSIIMQGIANSTFRQMICMPYLRQWRGPSPSRCPRRPRQRPTWRGGAGAAPPSSARTNIAMQNRMAEAVSSEQ